MKKSVNARLHGLAVANADKLFQSAFAEITYPDTHGRHEVATVHRLGSVLRDGETFHPVMLTVVEYKKDGNRIYSIESVDVAEYKKNSAGQLAAVAESERQAPIAEFVSMLVEKVRNVNDVSKIVDENGEPLVVLHGTWKGCFDVFQTEREADFVDIRTGKKPVYEGAYFTPSPYYNT